ncbi:septum formation initiator family protein [Alicyclobacillus cycloheptanicus]|uniref:Cell division protein FtsB n=1 Tax=Alicyclobacillus cycloheptanicus TaxID=1457 RepID=A0ABT9XIK5_9BACL|nr:septum formation initiator family protein [Alicyclobacillus cycloheptanicus]MDQ0190148.1 cell division protein FtsB [Alicyclobacillus cycloheptanicus]WDM02597.1 septum formation initiator family protein [Alicyclobacillus cycloheptanicus]
MSTRTAATSAANSPHSTSTRSVNRWFRIRYLAVVVIVAWAAYRLWHVEMPQLRALQHQQQTLQTKLTALQQQQTQLKTQVKEYQSKAFIAQYASQNLHLVLPGQVPFTIPAKH